MKGSLATSSWPRARECLWAAPGTAPRTGVEQEWPFPPSAFTRNVSEAQGSIKRAIRKWWPFSRCTCKRKPITHPTVLFAWGECKTIHLAACRNVRIAQWVHLGAISEPFLGTHCHARYPRKQLFQKLNFGENGPGKVQAENSMAKLFHCP